MTKKKEPPFTIIIDSREQKPYKLSYPTEVNYLANGDYSIKGYENEIGVERKSLNDFVGSITNGRERFEREIENLSNMVFGAIVIETDLNRVWKTPLFSKTNRKSIVNTALKWTVKYNIPIQFVSNRTGGKYAVENWCEAYYKYHISGKEDK